MTYQKKKKLSFKLDDKNLKVVESIPGYQHYIKNVGNSDLIVLLWSNEIFDVKKPDTYKIWKNWKLLQFWELGQKL